ncbi:hypothetical protein [Streptomyces sp. ODS05-4]|uniref:hypothetical protein n=1 Tax=Streptomyces sp. ODS05-4 TaxID=2944939 RepID=UPI0027E3F53E|nr:hypothetical protein [Streptomyces sp. ODS05-4]
MLGEEGLADHLGPLVPRDADALLAAVDTLLGGLGDGVSDDTALLALSVPARQAPPPPTSRTAPPAQENR